MYSKIVTVFDIGNINHICNVRCHKYGTICILRPAWENNPLMYMKVNQNQLTSLELSLSILVLPLRAKEEEFIFVICVQDLPNGFVLLKKQWNTPKKALLKFLFIKQYVIG